MEENIYDNQENVFEKRKPNKFARFLTVLGVIAFILGVIAMIAPYIATLYIIILVLIAMCTLGLLFFHEGFRSLFDKGKDYGTFALQLYSIVPYLAGASIALCGIAFLILILSKKASNRTSGLVINGIIIVISIIMIVLNRVFNLETMVT